MEWFRKSNGSDKHFSAEEAAKMEDDKRGYFDGGIGPKRDNRPNRSDAHLSAEDAAKMEDETRGYFDGIAPKRHTKPQRSEYSAKYVDAFANGESNNNGFSPEHVQFQRLQSDPEKLIYNGSEVREEFVETEYYKDVNCIDKQHHTTGTGFIKMERGKYFSLAPDCETDCHPSCKGNPATNDWIPSTADTVTFASEKPNRSEI